VRGRPRVNGTAQAPDARLFPCLSQCREFLQRHTVSDRSAPLGFDAMMIQSRRHPAGLFVLFFTEMWERFSYYGMRSLLVYYMIKHLQFSQEQSSRIYGLYTGFVYFTPLFGDMLADRVLGQRRTVVIGGVLMAIGHFLMAFETLFFPALLFLILGNGAFKPNISWTFPKIYHSMRMNGNRSWFVGFCGFS